MGPHLMRRPPKYVHGFIDRHGKPRFYFRRAGFKKVPLPGLPWSSQFMEAYEQAVAGQSAPVDAGARHTKPGSMRALAVSYFQSVDYRSMQVRTQRVYRGLIERFCEQADKDGNKFGDKRAALIGREHVVRLIATKADKPEAANQFRKVLRAMMKHAVEIGLRADNPTRDVRSIRVKSEGFHSWSDAEIAQFEKRHPVGSRARLAFALLLYTGQRRSDVVLLGRQHVRASVLTVRQQKTGTELLIPVHPILQAILDDTPKDNMTFLTTQFGMPFTSTASETGSATSAMQPSCRNARRTGCARRRHAGWRKPAARHTRSRRSPATRASSKLRTTLKRLTRDDWQVQRWRR
jgi:integrase